MRHNGVDIDKTQCFFLSPHVTMPVQSSARKTSAKSQSDLTGDILTKPPRTAKTITAFVGHRSEWNTTGAETPLEKYNETAHLLISRSM